jgi:hypothetical protein
MQKNKRKYHLIKWKRICRSKDNGGLNIKDPRKQNIWLLPSGGGNYRPRMGSGEIFWRQSIAYWIYGNVKIRFNDSPIGKPCLKWKIFIWKEEKLNWIVQIF